MKSENESEKQQVGQIIRLFFQDFPGFLQTPSPLLTAPLRSGA